MCEKKQHVVGVMAAEFLVLVALHTFPMLCCVMCLNYRLLSVFSVLIQHQREPGVFETAAPVLF